MKIIKLQRNLTVVLSSGDVLTHQDCDDNLYNSVMQNQEDEEKVKQLLAPELTKKVQEIQEKTEIIEDLSTSSILSLEGASVYYKAVSELSVPEDLALAIFRAEKAGDQQLLSSYKNFWTLACLNPDSRARMNLFWFLNKYEMKISSSGLFIAYRNVELKSEGSGISSELAKFIGDQYTKVKFKWKKSPKNYQIVKQEEEFKLLKQEEEIYFGEEYGLLSELYEKLSEEEVSPTYTDSYSKTFTIKIGEPVIIKRSECDSVQENTCSRGLHVASRRWLGNNYFGKISLMVLVNPADVVAVPPEDSYGKMRTCAYYPVQIMERDDNGDLIDPEIADGFEDDFLSYLNFDGVISDKEEVKYSIEVPDIPELNKTKIISNLGTIKSKLSGRVVSSKIIDDEWYEQEEDYFEEE